MSNLVNIINISAIESLIPILNRSPDLAELMKKGKTTSADWDLLFTAAGVGFALKTNKNLDKVEVMNSCNSIHPQLQTAIDNYFSFINKEKDVDRETLGAQTGVWLVWNLFKEEPNYEKHKKLISLLGHYIDTLLK